MIFINGVAFEKLAARSGSSAALHRFIGHILLSVLSGNTCVLPTLLTSFEYLLEYITIPLREVLVRSAPTTFHI